MKPAIDQMIAWLDGEKAKYSAMESVLMMDKGYRVLDKARTQAMKIKERCDADDADMLSRLVEQLKSEPGPC